MHIQLLIRKEEGFEDREASFVKELYDFNEYLYILVECSPMGYIVFNNNLSIVLESTPNQESPYFEEYDELIYIGPTYNYVKTDKKTRNNEDIYKHVVLNEELVGTKDTISKLKEISSQVASTIETLNIESNYTRSGNETAEIKNSNIIRELDTNGFNTNGNCGWVATSLITYYEYKQHGYSVVPKGYFDKSLVQDIQGSRSNSTWGIDVAIALDS